MDIGNIGKVIPPAALPGPLVVPQRKRMDPSLAATAVTIFVPPPVVVPSRAVFSVAAPAPPAPPKRPPGRPRKSETLPPARDEGSQRPTPPSVTSEMLTEVQAVIAKARQGDFLAYLRLNGFTIQSTEEHPEPLCMCPEHVKTYKAMAAVAYCALCGKPHYGDFMARETPKSSAPKPITCPHCGMLDCAGKREVFVETGQGWGKTLALVHAEAFLDGLCRYRGHRPTGIFTTSNKEESEARLDMMKVVMQRPNHRNVFGDDAVPKGRQKRSEIVFKGTLRDAETGKDKATFIIGGWMAKGTPSFPNGKHVDFVAMDDVCTQTTSIVKPKDGQNIKTKIEGTVLKSTLPLFTVMHYLSNTWRQGDTTSWMRKWTAQSATWLQHFVKCGGPDEDFKSPCERTLPREHLRNIYLRGDREYERSMMLIEVTDADLCFKDPSFYTTTKSMERAGVPLGGRSLDGLIVLETDEPEMLPYPKFISIDMGFTGASADIKNRSKTGIVVGSINPENGMIFLLFAKEDYIAAGDHLAELARLSNIYGTSWIMPDSGAAQVEFVSELERAGYEVTPYNATSLGSKAMRKERLCAFWNKGFVRLRVSLRRTSTEADAIHREIYKGHDKVAAAAVSFPAVVTDLLDALEIGCRKAWERYGEPRPELPKAKVALPEDNSTGALMMKDFRECCENNQPKNITSDGEDVNTVFEEMSGITAEDELCLADF